MREKLSGAVIGCCLFAATALVVKAEKASEELLKSYEFDINVRSIEKVNDEISPDFIINKYKIQTPILPPRLDQKQVEALVDSEIEELVEAEFPKSRFKDIEAAAKHKFRLYKLNDKIRIGYRNRRTGAMSTTVGFLRQKTNKGITLGDFVLNYGDMNPAELPHFFPKEHAQAVEREIRVQTKFYRDARNDYEKTIRRKLVKNIWKAEGYIYRRSIKQWVPREEVFKHLYKKEWLARFAEVRNDVEVMVLEEQGLIWNDKLTQWEDKDSASSELLPEAITAKSISKKVSKSVNEWADQMKTLFGNDESEGQEIWGEGDEGDAETKKDGAGAEGTKEE